MSLRSVLRIGYFYPDLLNLYGDNGNVEILTIRAKARNITVDVVPITIDTEASTELFADINLVFMGGGPDAGQQAMYTDLVTEKGPFLKKYLHSEGVGLFICGAYQLMGHYYKAADSSVLDGLGIFDLYTEHFGNHKPRCIGNMVCTLNTEFLQNKAFKNINKNNLFEFVGFENHGGRTYLGKSATPLAKVQKGYGNNGEDKTEGVLYKNAIGTYSHGPVLARNPHLADFLIANALKLDTLEPLAADFINDDLILRAHTASKNLKQ